MVRVRVCLSRFFCDERASALVWVSQGDVDRDERKRECDVRSLERRLRMQFGLSGAFCLTADGCWLPPTEPLAILDKDETITVVPLTSEFIFDSKGTEVIEENITEKDNKKKKRKKQKENIDESAVNDEVVKKTNGKDACEKLNSVSSTPNPVIEKDYSLLSDPQLISAIENIEKLHAELANSTETDDDIDTLKSKALSILKDATPNVISVNDGRIKKRKRVRIRKSKRNSSSIASDGESTTPHRVLLNGKVNSHIRFSSGEGTPMTVIRNPVKNVDEKPRIIQAIQPSLNVSSLDTLNVTETESFNNSQKNCDISYNVNTIMPIVDKYPIINDLPNKHDVILFKVLKMNEQYNPVISSPILGRVSDVSSENSLIKFAILDGYSECIFPTGKFNVEDTECTENLKTGEFDIVWNQVIEPRLIS